MKKRLSALILVCSGVASLSCGCGTSGSVHTGPVSGWGVGVSSLDAQWVTSPHSCKGAEHADDEKPVSEE